MRRNASFRADLSARRRSGGGCHVEVRRDVRPQADQPNPSAGLGATKRFRRLLVAAIALAAGGGGVRAETGETRLQLINGDYYAGRLADGAEPGLIHWQSADAAAPYKFAVPNVTALHFPRDGEPLRPDGQYCLELVGGDALFGSLVALTPDKMMFATKEFGTLTIDRLQVQRMTAWGDASGIEYLGPEGLHGWNALGDGAWTEEAGQLLTTRPGGLELPGLRIPSQASVEVELSWQEKADFSLQIGSTANFTDKEIPAPLGGRLAVSAAPPPAGCEVAVWGDAVVLVREQEEQADLAQLTKLPAGPQRLGLRLHLDQEAGIVSAYTLEGKFLASVKAGGARGSAARGLRLFNKRGDLRLERLVVRRWGGAAPQQLVAGKTYLQLRSGGPVAADGATLAEGDGAFELPGPDGQGRIPVDDVIGYIAPANDKLPDVALRVSLHDGARLTGNLRSVERGRMIIDRPGIAQPLAVPMELLRSVIGLKTRDPLDGAQPDLARMETAGSLSHGLLVAAEGDGESCLAWRPFGSVEAAPLRPQVSGRIVYRSASNEVHRRRIVRRAPEERNRAVWEALIGHNANPQEGDDPLVYDQLLWFRAGDRIPCRIKSIDERGVTFATPLLKASFVPHDSLKAWDHHAGTKPRDLPAPKKNRLLTLPRMQRENPPTHLIESVHGDFLRGRIESMDDKVLRISVRLETKEIPRENIARIIWFGDEGRPKKTDGEAVAANDNPPAKPPSALTVQALCNDGVRLTFSPEELADDVLVGESALLGPCAVSLVEIDQLYLGDAIASAAQELAYSAWRLYAASDPKYVTEDGAPVDDIEGLESSLVGQPAPDFALEDLSGDTFRLSEQRGKVVVLDFWATWCGWCMQSMPELDALAGEFDGQIVWIAVNLQQDKKTIADALERLGVNPRVALDIDGAAAEKFSVTAIPQTVVVGPGGDVFRVFVGGGPDLVDQLREAIRTSLEGSNEN